MKAKINYLGLEVLRLEVYAGKMPKKIQIILLELT